MGLDHLELCHLIVFVLKNCAIFQKIYLYNKHALSSPKESYCYRITSSRIFWAVLYGISFFRFHQLY